MFSDDPVGAALRRAMPVSDDDVAAAADRALPAVVREVQRRGSAQRRRARIRVVVAGMIGAVVVGGVGAPALANWIELKTGENNPSGQEMWNFDSPEATRLMISYTADYPLAPGYTTETMVEGWRGHSNNAAGPDILFRQIVNNYSRCTWEITWLNAEPGSRARAQAAEAIRLQPHRDRNPVNLYDDDTVAADQQLASHPELIRQDVKANCGGVRK